MIEAVINLLACSCYLIEALLTGSFTGVDSLHSILLDGFTNCKEINVNSIDDNFNSFLSFTSQNSPE